jgi:hypothetical protein
MAVCRSAARQDLDANQKVGSVVCGLPVASLPSADATTESDSRWKGIPQNKFASFRPSTPKSFNLKSGQSIEIACCSTASAIFTDDKIGLIEASLEAGARNARVVGYDVSRATT